MKCTNRACAGGMVYVTKDSVGKCPDCGGTGKANEVRQVYETEGDRQRQRTVEKAIETMWNVKAVQLPRSYRLDNAFLRNKRIVFWGEIKVRSNEAKAYAHYMISAAKLMAMVEFERSTQLPVALFVQFTDKLLYVRTGLSCAEWYEMGGRTDRGDKEDIEPVAEIPIGFFKEVDYGAPEGL